MDFTTPIQIEMQKAHPMDISNSVTKVDNYGDSTFSFYLSDVIKDVSSLLVPCQNISNQESTKDIMAIEKELNESNSKDINKTSNLFIYSSEDNNLGKKPTLKLKDNQTESKNNDNNNFLTKNLLLENIFNGINTISIIESDRENGIIEKISTYSDEINSKKVNINRDTGNNTINNTCFIENINNNVLTGESIYKSDSINFENISLSNISPILNINEPVFPDSTNEITCLIKNLKEIPREEKLYVLMDNYKYVGSDKNTELSPELFKNKATSADGHNTTQTIIIKNSDDKQNTYNKFTNLKEKETEILQKDSIFSEDNLTKFEPDEGKISLDKNLSLYEKDEIKCESINFENDKNKEIKPRIECENKLHDLNNTIVNSDKTKTIEKKPDTPEIPNIVKDSFVITRKESNFIEISLKPEGIGKLNIHLTLDNGMVHAKVDAFEIAGRDIINKNINDIVKVLLDEGINIGSFSINLKEKKGESLEYSNDLRSFNDSKERTDMPVISSGKYIINIFV